MQISKRVQIGLGLLLLLTVLMTLLRVIFFFMFQNTAGEFASVDALRSFYLGFKFDLRLSIIFVLPYFVLSLLGPLKNQNKGQKFWHYYASAITSITLICHLLDLGYYQYLQDRVNATALQFVENFWISANMVWQTYPVIPSVIAIAILSIGFHKLIGKLFSSILNGTFIFDLKSDGSSSSFGFKSKLTNICLSKSLVSSIVLILIFLGGLYGKLGYYPLRWSEAFFSGNRFVSALALNPIHYFFDTLPNRDQIYDLSKVEKHYDRISTYLGVDNKDNKKLNFTRQQEATPIAQFERPPNIVVIMMESFSSHRMGSFGNPSEATPYSDKMAKEGWLFTNFYTPSEGTARGVFTMITSVIDINKGRTSSRNPLIVNQNSAANFLKGYEKYYFIGGSANWGNIRGFLKNNIVGLNLFEEGMFDAPRTDVWGISDYHLFQESHKILKKESKPFFAVIQTAGFHRPYTIPVDRGSFQLKTSGFDDIKDWGFESLDEYNSLKFSDFAMGNYLKEAKSSSYFDNTIFVLLGDHGLPDNKSKNLSGTSIKFSLERFHTPLIFYSPKYLEPAIKPKIVMQQDVLPTLVAMAGFPIVNKGLGRNILDPQFDDDRWAFSYVYYRNPHTLFLFDDSHLLTGTSQKWKGIFKLDSDDPKDVSASLGEKAEEMKELLEGLYETSKYLLYNNQKPEDFKALK